MRFLVCWLFLTRLAFAAALSEGNAGLTVAESIGFCHNTSYLTEKLQIHSLRQAEVWESYCRDGNSTTGSLKTEVFTAASTLRFYIAGYPTEAGTSIRLEDIGNGSTVALQPTFVPREGWVFYTFDLPPALRGRTVRLVAEDRSSTFWFAVGFPVEARPVYLIQSAQVLSKTFLSLLLIALPALAVCAAAIKRGLRDSVSLQLVAFVTVGIIGYIFFWVFFAAPAVGRLCGFSLPLVALIALLSFWRKVEAASRLLLLPPLKAFGLTGALALLVLSTGFLYGGLENPLQIAGERFSHRLPPDNELPYIFARGLARGHVDKPLLGDWLSSDRPPLQAGIYLSQYAYLRDQAGYQVVSVIAQCFWIFALQLLLITLNVNRRAMVLTLVVCIFSGNIFLNSFYVWPKLLSAAFCLGFSALLFSGRLSKPSRLNAVLAGALLTFGMLSHGGAAFALLGMAMTALLTQRHVALKNLATMAIVAVILYWPWAMYQRFIDPPGDRLLKLQLAGVGQVDSRGLGQSLLDSYSRLTFAQWMKDRQANFQTTGHAVGFAQNLSRMLGSTDQRYAGAYEVRAQTFFYFLPCLGALMLGPFALLAGIRAKSRTLEWRFAAQGWLCIFMTIAIWCALMITPASTLLHQGTYFIVILSFTASILGIWALSSWLAVALAALQICFSILAYVVLLHKPAQNGVLVSAISPGQFCLAIISIVLIGYLLGDPFGSEARYADSMSATAIPSIVMPSS